MSMGTAKAFNPQAFLEFLCQSFFAGLMLHMVRSGKYLAYVTPRMEPYLNFTAIVMGIWALAGLGRMFRPQHKIRAAHCFVLAIPILLLLLPHSPLSASSYASNYVSRNALGSPQAPSQIGEFGAGDSSSATSQDPADDSPPDPTDNTPPQDPTSEGPEGGTYEEPQGGTPQEPQGSLPEEPENVGSGSGFLIDLPGLDVANKKIAVSDSDFSKWLSEIYSNMDKYEGYTVVMTGFVFKSPEFFEEDEFAVARLMMSCCVADLAPIGLICKYDEAAELQEESWVTVEGTLFIGEYEHDGAKYDDPEISVKKISSSEPVEGYIYPY